LTELIITIDITPEALNMPFVDEMRNRIALYYHDLPPRFLPRERLTPYESKYEGDE